MIDAFHFGFPDGGATLPLRRDPPWQPGGGSLSGFLTPASLAGLGSLAPVDKNYLAVYDAVAQTIDQAMRDVANRGGLLTVARNTAGGFPDTGLTSGRQFAERAIESMIAEARGANRPDFLAELRDQFVRRASPSAEERAAADRRFDAGLPEAPPLSAFESVWDKLDRYLQTLGTVGKVGAGIVVLALLASLAKSARGR